MGQTATNKGLLECCCGRRCVGCCLPVRYDNPQYPNGYVPAIPFEIIAPNCPEINGYDGLFPAVDPQSPLRGPCGPCNTFCSTLQGVLSGTLRYEIGGICMTTPCGFDMCLALECTEAQTPAEGLEPCCSRFRLWIGTEVTQVEDDGRRPSSLLDCQFSCYSWKAVAPTSCTCLPNNGGFSGRFSLAINYVCPTYPSGPCAGQLDCCVLNCDLSNAELVI